MGTQIYYVSILTNHYGASLYTGVTNDLVRRLYEHKPKLTGGFTARYNLHRLIYSPQGRELSEEWEEQETGDGSSDL